MKKFKRFLKKFKWWLRHHEKCNSFCPTCKHYSVCVMDEMYWKYEN